MREQERLMGPNTVGQGLEAKIAERLAGMGKREKQDELAAIRNAFIKFGTEPAPGGIGVAALKGIGTYGDASEAAKKAREGMDLELTKMQADLKKGERAEKRGNLDAAAKAFESAENRQLRLAEMQNQLKAAGISASRPGELEKAFALFEKDPAKFEQFIAAKDTNRGNLASATKSILEAKYPNYKLVAMTPPEKRTKEQNEFLQNAYKDAEATARDMMRKGAPSTTGGPAGGGGNLVQNKDGSFNYVPR
jgi:tetratricopeptide (TPR) repeat protein